MEKGKLMKVQAAEAIALSPEVKAALSAGRPVVALESTIISHGMPYPKNVETAMLVEKTIRDNGAVPATVYVAAVPYATADGGALVPAAQTPTGNGDGQLDAAEYVAFPIPCDATTR